MKAYFVFYSECAGYTFIVSEDNLLGKYGASNEYYFAAFTRSMDALSYCEQLNKR